MRSNLGSNLLKRMWYISLYISTGESSATLNAISSKFKLSRISTNMENTDEN